MDFTTTEAAHDLGGLVDTIVDSVCTPSITASWTGWTNDSIASCGASSSIPTS